MDPIIKVDNISLAYDLGKSNETRALKDVALEIYPEEYVILFGPSGCGKSTLLYIIAGLMRPTQGNIKVAGHELNKLDEDALVSFHQTTIGMIFQAYYLIPYLSAKDNVLMPQIFLKVPPQEREKKAEVLMERFGLTAAGGRRSTMLSGGQQQRVAIARALINDAPIILADEPVGNLDSKNAAAVLDLISDLNKKDKKTIIHVTHDPSHLSYADRVFYFRDGKLERVVSNKKEAAAVPKPKPEKPAVISFEPPKIPAPGVKPVAPQAAGPKALLSDFDKMALLYPTFSEARIKAKLYVNFLLLPFNIDAMIKIEELVEQYIRGKLDKDELLIQLDSPVERGGAGLNFQTARDLSERIIRIAEESRKVAEAPVEQTETKKSRTVILREFLLDQYSGNIVFEQVERLERGLALRLEGKFTELELREFFDAPLKQGGAGLNSRTANRFSEQVELILSQRSDAHH